MARRDPEAPERDEPSPVCEEQAALANGEVAKFFANLERLGEFAQHAMIGLALARLVDQVQTLILFHNHGSDKFHATVTWPDSMKQISVNRKGLLDALMGVFGAGPRKKCRRCGLVKELGDFSRYQASKDGRNCYCRVCERERAKRWKESGKPKTFAAVRFKRCAKCGIRKPFHQFGVETGRKDGRQTYCKKCRMVRR